MTATNPSEIDAAELALTLLDRLPEDGAPERIDHALGVLADRRRRLTVQVVRDHDEPLALPDVADEVAVRERDRPLPEISAETVTEVYVSIYHDHLPRLVGIGLLAYDQERDMVHPNY
ncbi:hypothetical protein [Halovivax sp.]|uniref:DUF7344 domain-containing protein n=1 Tax=Halovivax sp. TaxID=1935978 RepID=UPI0025C70EBB|nr:hypothetical protein [Halovivax sp.]